MMQGISIGIPGIPSLGSGGGSVPVPDVIRVRETGTSSEQDFNLTEWDDGTLDTFVGAGDGCVAKWYDDSGNDNDVVQATTTLQPKVAVSGTVQEGVKFDGTDDALIKGSRLTSGSPTALTAACFVKTTSAASTTMVSEYNTGGNQRMWQLSVVSGKLQVVVSQDGLFSTQYKQYDSTTSVNTGSWFHVAFVFNAGTLTLYIDGTEATVTKTADNAITQIYNATVNLVVGATNGGVGNRFNGFISNIHVEQAALTAGNIATLAAGGEVGSPLLWLKGNYSP